VFDISDVFVATQESGNHQKLSFIICTQRAPNLNNLSVLLFF